MTATPVKTALLYARRGIPVVPVYRVPNGVCGRCDLGEWCDRNHALVEGTGSTDQDQIQRWWREWPNAEVGIVSGLGVTVLRHGGESEARRSEQMSLALGCASYKRSSEKRIETGMERP